MAEDRAHDQRRVFKRIEVPAEVAARLDSSLGQRRPGEGPDAQTLRETPESGFRGQPKNGVRTRTSGGSSLFGPHYSQEQYNQTSTHFTERAASGATAARGREQAEAQMANDTAAGRRKAAVVKIDTDPAKGK